MHCENTAKAGANHIPKKYFHITHKTSIFAARFKIQLIDFK
jgi:hypothetical protein